MTIDPVAQQVEQRPFKPWVAGSIPAGVTFIPADQPDSGMASDLQVLQQLEQYIRSHRGKITISDFAAATGLPLEQVQNAFYTLLERYECKVTMDPESGNVVFAFQYPLRPRNAKSFREIALSVATTAWKIFVKVYKAAIGVILIIYTVIFVLLLLFAAASGSSSDSRNRRSSASIDLGAIFRLLWVLAEWKSTERHIQWQTDASGFRYPVYQTPLEDSPSSKKKKKRFLQAVYDFVFGPEYPKYSPLEDAKEAAAFIYFNDGVLTSGHIVGLTGKSYEVAESRLTEYLARFQGDAEISEEGIVIGHFPKLTREAIKTPPSKELIIPYPDEADPPVVHNGNTTGQNIAIIAMNAFNLGMSWAVINYFSLAGVSISTAQLLEVALGYFPFIVSVLYFIIPILRIPYVLHRKQKREREIVRKKLFRSILWLRGAAATEEDILRRANITDSEIAIAKSILAKLVLELQGELNLTDDGKPQYEFSRLHREIIVGSWFRRYLGIPVDR